MEQGTRTAIYLGIAIAAAVGAMSAGLSLLEEQPAPVQEAGQQAPASKLGFKSAPSLAGIAGYINTTPEDLAEQMEGKVILYDIWTYSCINCIRTLPYITAWDAKYADEGLLILGIHSPEFEFEKDMDNVALAVDRHDIQYPVILDNDKEIWNAFENRYWPRKYIADHEGYIRYDHIGEGAYKETESIIQKLLRERADALGMQSASAEELVPIKEFEHSAFRTPELYFGYKFAAGRDLLGNTEGFRPGQEVAYSIPESREQHSFYLDGTWYNGEDGMRLISDSGSITLEYHAKQVNIVAGGQAEIEILLDGQPIAEPHAGSDVVDGKVSTTEHDLYNLVSSGRAGTHELEIRAADPGFEMFTFTFG